MMGDVSPMPNPLTGGPSLVSCLRLLTPCIRSYPLYLAAISFICIPEIKTVCSPYQNFVAANSFLDVLEALHFSAFHGVVACTTTDVKQEVLYHHLSICCKVNLWRQAQTTCKLNFKLWKLSEAFVQFENINNVTNYCPLRYDHVVL